MRFMSFAGLVQKDSQNLFSQHGSARLPSFLLPSIYVQRTLPSESETLNKPQDEKQAIRLVDFSFLGYHTIKISAINLFGC